ncbi:uncharacterized protein [Nicotiana sylvestris]|uniref:uncharacterized protein n=1 Tax=Nicotiana sylvestris TaxID=4096 RepID=UPI00388C3FED
MFSSNSNPKRVPIVNSFPNAPSRSRKGGRLRNLGSSSLRGSSLPSSGSSPAFRTRGSFSQKCSSKGKEPSEPVREPTVDEIVPAELSFYNDRESLRNQVSSLDRADIYPTHITEGLISLVRNDCHWSHDFPIIIPNPNQRITSYLTGFSFIYTYPFTLGFKPAIDPVILEFYRFFDVCLSQIDPIVWRVVACLSHLSNMASVPFTFSHLIHLYSPRLFRNGVFTLVARSKRVLVSPEDDKDRGWYARFVAVPTVGLVGGENIPFPEKWNFAPTMGIVEEISNFRDWVGKLLNIAPVEGRSWKNLSHRFGWKVKTHEFAIRGISAETVAASHISLERAKEIILGSLSKRKAVDDEDSEKDEDGGSLITRPRARRRIISDDKAEASPRRSIPLTKFAEAPILIPDDVDDVPTAAHDFVEKSGQADVWLKPLIGPIERTKLNNHSSLTLMNDIVDASLKANLIGTEMMRRVTLSDQLVRDYQLEAYNWKEQYESLQIDVEFLEESRSTLEQQVRALTSELAVEKASSSQADKEKARLETSFSEQLSKASEEIRELKALLAEKEAYAGELVKNLAQTQEDLRVSSDKESALAENEKLKNEISDWERDYEILEDKSVIEVSWAFLNSHRDTLVEASQENFNLESELAKIKETIEKAQQNQDFSSPVAEASENVEIDMGIPTPSSQVEPAAVEVFASVPSSNQ